MKHPPIGDDASRSIVVPCPGHRATGTCRDVLRRADAIHALPDDAEDHAILAEATELRDRLLRLADACRAAGDGAGRPSDADAQKSSFRRRRRILVLEDGSALVVSGLLAADGTGTIRQVQFRHPEEPAQFEVRGLTAVSVIPAPVPEDDARRTLREAAVSIRNSLETLLSPCGPDALPAGIVDAARGVLMLQGDATPSARPDVDWDTRSSVLVLPSPWRRGFLHEPQRRSVDEPPEEASRLPVCHQTTIRFESGRGLKAAVMMLEPCRVQADLDVVDPLARLRLLAALHKVQREWRGSAP